MATIALELVPTAKAGGETQARQEAQKVKKQLEEHGLENIINTILVPQIVQEDGDRPVPITEKLAPEEFYRSIQSILPKDFILTQVTAFTPRDALEAHIRRLRADGIERVVFVGVPRVFDPATVVGPSPAELIAQLGAAVPSRGIILIPTRPGEVDRCVAKLEAGATFAVTQLLFSHHIVTFLRQLAARTSLRPEIVLSFGYVPKLERQRGLIQWLIRDATDRKSVV